MDRILLAPALPRLRFDQVSCSRVTTADSAGEDWGTHADEMLIATNRIDDFLVIKNLNLEQTLVLFQV